MGRAKSTVATNEPAKSNVTPIKSTAVAMAVDDDAMAKFSGMGTENVTVDDINIPRILLLQGLSPQLDSNKAEYIEEAKSGDFADSTGVLFKKGLEFVVCHFAKQYLEWHPERGKGLQANHGTDASVLQQATKNSDGKMIMPSGNVLEEHWTFYVLNLSAHGKRSTISLSRTQRKAAKDLNSSLREETIVTKDGRSLPAPAFYRSYVAEKSSRTNTKGSWHGWGFEPGTKVADIDPDGGLLSEAVDYRDQARKGEVNVNFSELEGEDDTQKE